MKGDGGVVQLAEGMDPRWMPPKDGEKEANLLSLYFQVGSPFNEKKVHRSFQIDDE